MKIGQIPLIWCCLATLFVSIGCQKASHEEEQRSKQQDSNMLSSLRVENAYMRELAPKQHRAAVYLQLHNGSDMDRAINLVDTSIAGYAEIHSHSYDNGVMKMRKVQHPTIAAGASMEFSPGGYHVMLFDIESAPAAGDTFEMSMDFDRAESLQFQVRVISVSD